MKLLFKTISLTIFIMVLVIPLFGGAQSSANDFPIDLLWRADTFLPAGFPGKALAIKGSQITVVAVTPTQNASQLNYTWIVRDSSSSLPGADKKGIGEDTFSFRAEDIIPNFKHKIRLTTRNLRTGVEATKEITIQLTNPEVHLYKNIPWGQKIKGKVIASPGSSYTFLAKPFYFNVKNIMNLGFNWTFNNQELRSDAEPDRLLITVSSDTATGIEKKVKLIVKNKRVADSLRENAVVSSNFLVLP